MHTTTRQPQWKRIANLGDINPIEYGGAFVYVDRTGAYPPELELLDPIEGDRPSWELRRFPLDRCTFVDSVLSDNAYHPEIAAWFAASLPDVARTCDRTEIDMIAALCGDDPIARAWAYHDIANYHGFDNFDAYPVTYTKRSDLPRRIRRVKGGR